MRETDCPGKNLERYIYVLSEEFQKELGKEPGIDDAKEFKGILAEYIGKEPAVTELDLFKDDLTFYHQNNKINAELLEKYGSRENAITKLSEHVKSHISCLRNYLSLVNSIINEVTSLESKEGILDQQLIEVIKEFDVLNMINLKK